MTGKVLILFVLLSILTACVTPASDSISSTTAPSTLTPIPKGKTIIVTSTEDSGPGTLRWALEDAQSGDKITFDPNVFSSDDPVTIFVLSELPGITLGALKIDASNAGVILDGTKFEGQPANGLQIFSDGNTLQGLQIVGFSEAGIVICGGAKSNLIGGDPNVGIGPTGQGNLISNNNIGIGIWDIGATNNTITGNIIGTDTSRTCAMGNEIAIAINSGASHNVIGPGNIIAYNQQGVIVGQPGTMGNVISQNSFYSNAWGSIDLSEGGNDHATAPYILEFDLDASWIKGSACPHCTMEVFSTDGRQETTVVDQPTTHSAGMFSFEYDGREGAIFEGQTTADSSGSFFFEKGTSFAGKNLTVTSTDPDGNTSCFSAPTIGPSGSMVLQKNNQFRLLPLSTFVSTDLEFNRIGEGVSLYSFAHPDDPDHETPEGMAERMSDLGMKWMNLGLNYGSWSETDSPEKYSQFHVDPLQDQAVEELRDRGIRILFNIVYWDKDIQTTAEYSRFKNEDEIRRFLEYVQFIVGHFAGRIDYYSLLSESDLDFGTQQYVEPLDYVNLVRRVVPVIRQADPQAKIIIGEVSPLVSPSSINYFFEIIHSDVLPLVDGISWHSSGDTSPEYQADEYYEYQTLLPEIRRVASENGFRGEFWATELHWRTSASPHPSEYDEYTGRAAAKYLARGILMHQGMDFMSGIVEIITMYKTPVVQNLATLLAGAEPLDLTLEVETQAEKVLSFAFRQPNGDQLVTIWSDGIAVDFETGVPAKLTIPATTAKKVTGIDILNNFEQQMVFVSEDGNLIIDNLLIKDYPIIFRLTGATSP